METMQFQIFDPKKNDIGSVPSKPGNYIVVLRKDSKLPDIGIPVTYCKYEGYNVIYTGLASKNLKDRDIQKHFNGTAGGSTLRKSLGCLFGYDLIPRDSQYDINKKTKFNDADESRLSDWMREHLLLFYYSNENYNEIESRLIQELNPPLNLDKNSHVINSAFRGHLKSLRNRKPNQSMSKSIKKDKYMNKEFSENSGKGLYREIWKDYLADILSNIKKGGGSFPITRSRFESAGNRAKYSFRLDIDNSIVPRKRDSAVARDLKTILDNNTEFKTVARGKNITIRLDSKFELFVEVVKK